MKGSFETWENFRKTLHLTKEEESEIQLQVELIAATIKAREEAKLSQRDLAEKTGIKQATISRIERMKVSPRVDTLMHLLNQIGYTLEIVPLNKK